MDELSEEDKLTVERLVKSKFLSQPFAVAPSFHWLWGSSGQTCWHDPLLQEILEGKHDALPEAAFYMVGDIDDAIRKAGELTKEMSEKAK